MFLLQSSINISSFSLKEKMIERMNSSFRSNFNFVPKKRSIEESAGIFWGRSAEPSLRLAVSNYK